MRTADELVLELDAGAGEIGDVAEVHLWWRGLEFKMEKRLAQRTMGSSRVAGNRFFQTALLYPFRSANLPVGLLRKVV